MFRFFLVLMATIALVAPGRAQAQEQEGAPADTVEAAAAEGVTTHVARAVFTTAVTEREPVDRVDTLKTDVGKVFFFSEIVGMEGRSVTHRWLFNGETQADVSFDIGGARWRVYSSKTLVPEWVGKWTVEVRDGEGNTLHTASFEYANTP